MDLIASLQCADQPGIVHAMTSAVLAAEGNIIENQQFTDHTTNTFVMRTRFESAQSLEKAAATLQAGLSQFKPALHIRPTFEKPRALVLVTKESHCLRDLLYLLELNEMPVEIPLVISNREDLKDLVEAHGIPFLYLPIDSSNKEAQEAVMLKKIEELSIDFVVLARYMQILSSEFCAALPGKIINIHHSFLPGFKGAKPYHQAHDRGVKIIGATAHFVTADLDEGPIICQEIVPVNHTLTAKDMSKAGKEVEKIVLSKALNLVLEDRVFIHQNKTILFE